MNKSANSPVRFAIGVEPEQAIEYLRQKKLLASKVHSKQLQDSALARATTISRLSSLEMTKDIYASMERAMREGKAFAQWKKELVAEFQRKGWVAGKDKKISRGIDGNLLADPKTGEYFGTPRRLNTIYRVNMQAAYSSARYQRLMDNVDNRPYWQYSAVGDERTRPAHLALSGRIYRYDDPFWATFYPPNGFNCRCTVMALSDRDLKRRGMEQADSSEPFLVDVQRPADKQGNIEQTVGFKLPDGSVRVADKGFDYNIGRLTYRPNLDLYPEKLAHQFAKAEMSGGEFKLGYQRFEEAYFKEKAKLGYKPNDKIKDKQELILVENLGSLNFHFSAGRLTKASVERIKANTSTVWFSDQSLIKQFNSRLDDVSFGVNSYSVLPDVLHKPMKILDDDGGFAFYQEIDEVRYVAVVKYLPKTNEIFLLSFRKASDRQWARMLNSK